MSGREAQGPDQAQSFDISSFLLRTTDGSTWDVSDAAKFDFAGFFDWMVDCRHLLLAKDELTWMETQRVVDARAAIFLNMSCGTQLAPHLTLDTVSVFRVLGIDFVAGSGRQYCCGKIYRSRGRMSAGESMSHASLDRIMEWGAQTAVHTCHSCQIMYTDYTTRVADAAPGLGNTHVSEFIEARLRELGDRVPWRKTLDLRVLVEGHGPEVSPVHHAATEAETRLLALIPGVRVVGLVEAPSRGMPCKSNVPAGPTILAFLTDAERLDVQRDLRDQATRRDANVIAPNAHYCHREWSKFGTEGLPVKHWISILAEALGCAHEDRFQSYWRLRDPEKVVQLTRDNWSTWGLTEEQAREAALKHFEPHFTGFVNAACACGGDPGKCTTGNYTIAGQEHPIGHAEPHQ